MSRATQITQSIKLPATFAASLFSVFCFLFIVLCSLFSAAPTAAAVGSQQNPQSGSVGLQGTVASPPPTQAATIGVPGNGQTFSNMPITISGLCKTGLLVKV